MWSSNRKSDNGSIRFIDKSMRLRPVSKWTLDHDEPIISTARHYYSSAGMKRRQWAALLLFVFLYYSLSIETSFFVAASSATNHDASSTEPDAVDNTKKTKRVRKFWKRKRDYKSLTQTVESENEKTHSPRDPSTHRNNVATNKREFKWWRRRRPKISNTSAQNAVEATSLNNAIDDESQLPQPQIVGPVNCPHYNMTSAKGGSLVGWGRKRKKGNMEMAYRMAVLSTLVYWEFHKDELPQDCTGFDLLSHKGGKPRRVNYNGKNIGSTMQMQGCRISNGLGRIKTGLQHTLQQDLESKLPSSTARRLQQAASNETNADPEPGKDFVVDHGTRDEKKPSCGAQHLQKHSQKDSIEFQYYLYNWFEPTKLGNFHDTDLLISTADGGRTLIISFAGTASPPDTVTIVQTFEPANHSGLFHGGVDGSKRRRQIRSKNRANATISVRGAVHRGFLNAYSRVERGSILRLCQNCTDYHILENLNKVYGHCTKNSYTEVAKLESNHHQEANTEASASADDTTLVKPIRKRGGCRVKDTNLMTVLRRIVVDALKNGRTVHVNGHSLGGALSLLLSLDIVVNFPDTPISRLHLWTFGAPQIADDDFLESMIELAPRLAKFLDTRYQANFHRFVTLSDRCEADVVATVAQQTLSPFVQGVRAKAARRIGGIRNEVVHLGDPYYLLTPNQHGDEDSPVDADISEMFKNSTSATKSGSSSSTRTSVDAHKTLNYIRGVSRQSSMHPLSTDLPVEVRQWLGEIGDDLELH